jgi:hypothetical protein
MADLRLPSRVEEALSEIAGDPTMNDGMEAVMERVVEFESRMAAKLTGVFLNPLALARYDEVLDELWANGSTPTEASEIVIGSGLHAAIYCAVRVRQGFPKPLVIEASPRAGGAFATTRLPSLFLNSRNRPGRLGIPGREEALNVIPAAPVQPADLSGAEYQTNTALAFSIRASLALNARIVCGRKVITADASGVVLDDGRRVKATRVIWATGLGEPSLPPEADGERVIHYMDFLAMLDRPFPFQGLRRVAVVGAGDSGKTAIEALIGQGPSTRWSVPSLDYVEKIDWYGVERRCCSKKGWEANNRSRYAGIGRALPLEADEEGELLTPSRVTPINGRAETLSVGFGGASINGVTYDLVVWAGGFDAMDIEGMVEYSTGGRAVARMSQPNVFVVGPAAQLPPVEEGDELGTVAENSAALFRYADRTAVFAAHLPQFALPAEPDPPPPPSITSVTMQGEPNQFPGEMR